MRKKFLVSDPFFPKAIIQKMLYIYASTSCQNCFVICMIYLVHCAFEDVLPEKIQTMVLHGQFH